MQHGKGNDCLQKDPEMFTGMKFTLDQLGPIDHAELELGDLTIIAGKNNTGKTYTATALYGYFRNIEDYVELFASSGYHEEFFAEYASNEIGDVIDEILEIGYATWELSDEALNQVRRELIENATGIYSRIGIGPVFTDPEGALKKASLKVDFALRPPLSNEARFTISSRSFVTIKRAGAKVTAALTSDRQEIVDLAAETGAPISDFDAYYHDEIYEILSESYFSNLLRSDIPSRHQTQILNSHRLTIPLLFREIDRHRTDRIHRLKARSPLNTPLSLAEDSGDVSSFSDPVIDNIALARQLPELLKGENLSSRYLEELKAVLGLIGGRFESANDEIRFVPKEFGDDSSGISLHLASSAVQQMPLLYGVLKYYAVRFLIVDEPESHLDTENQIHFARLLARLAHSGMNILITTHSDYIVKEINNLIMLSSDFEDKEQISDEFNYGDGEFLHPHMVKAYIAENGTLSACKIDEFGMKMPVFDDTINSINRASTKLATRIVLGQEEEEV